MMITLIVCFVLLIAAFINYQVYKWKRYIPPMNGMMVAMTLAMMVSLTIGISFSIEVVNDPTIATIYMIVLGIFIGYVTGFPFGILAQVDGVLAGVMGGLMGPMTGLMISNNNPNLFIGFFTMLYVFTTLLVYQLILQTIPSSAPKKMNRTWFVFLPICIILTGLSIYQSNTEALLHANPEESSILKEGVQEAVIQVEPNGYTPSNISLQSGIPVKLNFQRTSDTGCLSSLLIRDLGINQKLKKGDNFITFTPNKPRVITYTCGMGMYHGSLLIK